MHDGARDLIRQRVTELGLNLKQVSIALGRNHAYLQQYLTRGIPATLPQAERRKLASLLKISEHLIGGDIGTAPSDEAFTRVPIQDVRASAGGGSHVDSEPAIGVWPFPADYLRNTLSIRNGSLAMIEVIGDSMEPTLRSGDRILIDLADRNIAMPGVFALYDGDATVVKRVEKVPGRRDPEIELISDNPLHGRYRVRAEDVAVAGRVVWVGRRL